MKHAIYLMLGSNIEPEKNTRLAIQFLAQCCQLRAVSNTWQTKAVGSQGPDFLNTALLLESDLSAADFKQRVIAALESSLGRIRTADKNAPRTMDVDIIVFDGEILDASVWEKAFIAIPMAELYPDLRHPENGILLKEIVRHYEDQGLAVRHPLPPVDIS